MLRNNLLYNVKIYMVFPTLEDYIAILSAKYVHNGNLTFGTSSGPSGNDKHVFVLKNVPL